MPAANRATPNRPAGLNRALLTLAGVVLLLGGAYVLARGLGLLTALGPLPTQPADTALVPAEVSVQWWVPYVVIVGAAVLGIACLVWLVAQTGRRRPPSQVWRLPGDTSSGATMVDTDAAATSFADEVAAYPGVQRATAAITGSRGRPFLHLTVTTTDDASATDLRRRIDTEALTRLRAALELDALPTEILLRLGTRAATDRIR